VENKKWGTKHQIGEVLVGDETATIILTLWNEDIDKIEQGCSYLLEDAYISVHDECMKLCKSRKGVLDLSNTEVQNINKERNMSLPFEGKEKRTGPTNSDVRTLDGIPASRFKKYCGHKDF
jgi:replication factor A1